MDRKILVFRFAGAALVAMVILFAITRFAPTLLGGTASASYESYLHVVVAALALTVLTLRMSGWIFAILGLALVVGLFWPAHSMVGWVVVIGCMAALIAGGLTPEPRTRLSGA